MTPTSLTNGASAARPQAAGTSRFAAHTARIPASAGVGFKHTHLDAILSDPDPVGFVEVHAENYMGDGGFPTAPWSVSDRIFRFHCMGSACPSAAPSR